MLKTAGFQLPTRVHVHGFLTVNGEKMSKRKGTFVLARTYLEHLSPDYLRYYYASKLSSGASTTSTSTSRSSSPKVNSDLVGKVVNLASRTARFVEGRGALRPLPRRTAASSPRRPDGRRDRGGLRGLRLPQGACAASWRWPTAPTSTSRPERLEAAQRPRQGGELRDVCTVALNLFRQITIYLAPVLPELAERAGALLNAGAPRWEDAATPLAGNQVAPFEHLMQRVDPKHIEAMIEASQEAAG